MTEDFDFFGRHETEGNDTLLQARANGKDFRRHHQRESLKLREDPALESMSRFEAETSQQIDAVGNSGQQSRCSPKETGLGRTYGDHVRSNLAQ
ncbi:hypothetical protein CLE01_31560 [Cryobacterium levicorallinum]|nr:hypothetical protein CLE01_31560 [Cryobacterium levicorallinum]